MGRREISAGCVIFRKSHGATEVALIRPRSKAAWALPKGLIEKGENAETSAIREAREETGLTGILRGRLETIRYTYRASWLKPPTQIFKVVTFFLMECTGGDTSQHDIEVDEVQWFPIDDALTAASYKLEKEVLQKAKGVLEPGSRVSV